MPAKSCRKQICRQRIFKGCIDDGAAAEAKSTEDLKHEYLQVRHTKHKHRSSEDFVQVNKFKLSIPEEFTWETSRDITIQSNDAKAKPIVLQQGKGKAFNSSKGKASYGKGKQNRGKFNSKNLAKTKSNWRLQ